MVLTSQSSKVHIPRTLFSSKRYLLASHHDIIYIDANIIVNIYIDLFIKTLVNLID